MTRFIDGPAQGKTLMLRRAPFFLRVVTRVACESGKVTEIDALDQLDDFPCMDETLYAYQLTGRPGFAFIDGPKTRGRYAMAEYRLVAEQPTDSEMRDNAAWARWTEAHKHLADGVI